MEIEVEDGPPTELYIFSILIVLMFQIAGNNLFGDTFIFVLGALAILMAILCVIPPMMKKLKTTTSSTESQDGSK